MEEKRFYEFEFNGKDVRLYPMSVLESPDIEFDEDEIDEFICGDWLYDSFSVGAALVALEKPESESQATYEMMASDRDWFKKVTWTKEQRVDFEKRVQRLLVKFLEYDDDEAWHEVQIWSGFGSAPGLDDLSEENYRAYIELFDKASGIKIDEY